MIKFSQIRDFSRSILDDAGLQQVTITPGPEVEDVPDECLVWTPFPGAGLDADGALDIRSWQFRAIGKQNDYESAEDIANVIDIAFLSHHSSRVSGVWVASISRVGGAPTPLLVDNGDRTHFVCSYLISVELALRN